MDLLSAVASNSLGTLFSGIGGLAKDIRSAITGEPSPEKMAEISLKLAELENLSNEGQNQVNKVEAAHPSIFVAGWRPFIGWVCGFGIGAKFVFIPVGVWVCSLFDIQTTIPAIETGELLTLVLGMLGLGGLRTFEKYTGATKR
jgi:hypothetical protein